MKATTSLLFLLAAAPAAADPGSHDLYLRYCASCHGSEGRGDGPAASALQPPPANLTKSTLDRAALVAVIDGRHRILGHGSEQMPVWGLLFAEESPGTAAAEETARIRIEALASEVIRLRTAAHDH